MLIMRRSQERGFTNLEWLKSYHTFSFGGYYDPLYLGFESLRVINDDTVAPGGGFPAHSHKNMEIISYVLEGSLEHKDNMGNGSIIKAGDVQRMSAGSGVTHSEYNASLLDEVHFLQIWFIPAHMNFPPSYDQKQFSAAEKYGRFLLIASQEGRNRSLSLHQDVEMWASILDKNTPSLTYHLKGRRKAWIHLVRGKVQCNEYELEAGDGVGISIQQDLVFKANEESEILIFDMAPL